MPNHLLIRVRKLATQFVNGSTKDMPYRQEIPFEDIKLSGLMTKIKPNGSVRVILNLSKVTLAVLMMVLIKENFQLSWAA